MLFVISSCLNSSLIGREETLVGGQYCFTSGCLYFEYLKTSFPVQQVSNSIVNFKNQLNFFPFLKFQHFLLHLAINAASADKESIQYYRKIEMCGGQR
jgi:hypothetical protein